MYIRLICVIRVPLIMQKELLYQNKKIAYRIIGDGKPVILIHGFGEDGTVWNDQIEFLKNKYRLVVPDLPGSGQSEMIDDMSMEGMAEVIKAIITSLPSEGGFLESPNSIKPLRMSESQTPPSEGFGAACVIGHSMGGYITLALVDKYPGYISAFGLFHSSAYADSEEKKATRRKGIDFINQHGAFEFLKTATPNLFSPNSKLQIPASIEEIIERGRNFSSAALVSYYEAMMQRPDRTELLRKTTVPVLFIMGEYDNAVPMKDTLEQSHLPEKSHIHILRQSGHMGMLEEPANCNQVLEQFLQDS